MGIGSSSNNVSNDNKKKGSKWPCMNNESTDDAESDPQESHRQPVKSETKSVQLITEKTLSASNNSLIGSLDQINKANKMDRCSISKLCSENLKAGFEKLINSESQWEFVVFLLTHYPGLHKFFGVEVLKAEHLQMCKRYQDLGRKQVVELSALVESYADPEEWDKRVRRIITMHTRFGLTVRNYEVFFQKALVFLDANSDVDEQINSSWMVIASEFCLIAEQLCPKTSP